jgi:hypothetical protein
MKQVFFLISVFSLAIPALAKQTPQVMHSNQAHIKLMIGEGENDWTITPTLNPDILELYSETEKIQNVKFISDIDSIEFNVKMVLLNKYRY